MITLIDGSTHTVFDDRDMIELVREKLSPEIADRFEEILEELEEVDL